MCSPQGIMDNIIGKAMDAAFQVVKCTIHYKKNHKDLKDEMENFKKLSKLAQEIKENVTNLKREGHFTEIAFSKPPPPELQFRSDDDYEIFDSRASIFKMVVDTLKDSKVTVIGVHGTGGVGKTTLVKEISKQLKEDRTFDEVVMAVVSRNANVSKIQSQLVGPLNLDLSNATTEEQISYKLWHRLNNGKKNLVILDDIWKEVNLKAIGIPVTDGNKGCKVVITSRNRGVLLRNMKVDRDFALPLLPEPEAWTLFEKVVGNSVDSPELYSIAYATTRLRMWSKCKMHNVTRDVGISIAQEYLVEHGVVSEWPKKRKYESYSEISIRSRSMDELPNELACPQLRILMLESNNPSLLKVPDGFFSGMKELEVIDFNRMCMSPLPSSLPKLANLQMLCLNECKLADIAILKDLQGTLEMLSLRGSDIEVLPQEIGHLTRLRLLDLRYCGELKVIPHGVISNLTCLEELYFSDQFYQWDKKKTSGNVSLDELRSLTRLTTLHVHIPKDMLFPKESSLNFENLVRFKISIACVHYRVVAHSAATRFLNLEEIPLKAELNTLVEKAEELHLLGVEGLKKVLHDRGGGEGFLSLKFLRVQSCYDLDHLLGKPKWFMQPSRSFNKLTTLIIRDCRLKYLSSPSSIRGLLQLKQLDVAFPSLKRLVINQCSQITDVWDKKMLPSESFFQLRTVTVITCGKLVNVFGPIMVSRLQNLQEVFIAHCPNMEVIISKKGEEEEPNDNIVLPQLTNLNLQSLKNLKSFCTTRSEVGSLFNHKVAFPALEILRIQSCSQIADNLQEVSIDHCPDMEVIISKKGEEEGDEGAEPNDNIVLPQLRNLELRDLKNLKSFCTTISEAGSLFNHQVIFPALERLGIWDVHNITDIWDKQSLAVQYKARSFCQLTTMTVSDCKDLRNVFPSNILPWLHNLDELNVSKCPNMEVIVFKNTKEEETINDDLILFPRLRTIEILSMENLKSFCDSSERSDAQPLFNHQVWMS
ncbi:hypothetical protein Acr_17g0011860 [Actinidia rufa]|uniref:AAA+ ATPase domain-containing protein n=1 Tax=Actinidia rufa TaxID=165716 RepID=A0A7J0G487_9ERIC|nr:hypothetical protein Acr_17g0011860 [Actinidia rufa]